MSFLSSHRAIDTMARWRPLWANFVRDNGLGPSQVAGYFQQRDRPYLLMAEDFDERYEGFCRLCGRDSYPYTPDQCPHLKSDKHAWNVRSSDSIPWCNPPGAVQRNLVDEPDQMIEAPEAPEALLAIEAPEALAGPIIPEAPEAMLDADDTAVCVTGTGRRCRDCGYGVQSSDGDWEFVGRPGDILTRIEELEAKQDQLSNEVAKLRLLVGIPELEAEQEQLSNEVASPREQRPAASVASPRAQRPSQGEFRGRRLKSVR